MIKKIAAIIAAAACAGVMVTVVPAPEVAAGTAQSVDEPGIISVIKPAETAMPTAEEIRRAVEQNIRNGSHEPKIVCAQSWPYYESSCLRDSRQANGAIHAVRMIASDRPAAVDPHR
jgi:hypothetical protein